MSEPTIATGCGPITLDVGDQPFPRFILQFQAHEEEEFRLAADGAKWKSAIEDFVEQVRHRLKYGDPGENGPGLETARAMLFHSLEEEGLSLYD